MLHPSLSFPIYTPNPPYCINLRLSDAVCPCDGHGDRAQTQTNTARMAVRMQAKLR